MFRQIIHPDLLDLHNAVQGAIFVVAVVITLLIVIVAATSAYLISLFATQNITVHSYTVPFAVVAICSNTGFFVLSIIVKMAFSHTTRELKKRQHWYFIHTSANKE